MNLRRLGPTAATTVFVLALAGCGAEPSGENSAGLSMAVHDPSSLSPRVETPRTIVPALPPETSSCLQPEVLTAEASRSGIALGGGSPSNICNPSDAPQRFFRIEIPPQTSAIIRAQPDGDWVAVVRVLPACDSNKCDTVVQSAAPGIYVQILLQNVGVATEERLVTVSGENSQVSGRFDLSLELSAIQNPAPP